MEETYNLYWRRLMVKYTLSSVERELERKAVSDKVQLAKDVLSVIGDIEQMKLDRRQVLPANVRSWPLSESAGSTLAAKQVVPGGMIMVYKDGSVTALDSHTGTVNTLAQFSLCRKIVSAAVSRDGSMVAMCLGVTRELVQFDFGLNRWKNPWGRVKFHGGCPHLKYSDDGKLLLVLCNQGLSVFSTNANDPSLNPIAAVTSESTAPRVLACAHSNHLVAFSSGRQVEVVQVSTSSVVRRCTVPDTVSQLHFTANSTLLVLCNDGVTETLHSLDTRGNCSPVEPRNTEPGRILGFMGNYWLRAFGRSIVCSRLGTMKQLVIHHQCPSPCEMFTLDGVLACVGASTVDFLYFYNCSDAEELHQAVLGTILPPERAGAPSATLQHTQSPKPRTRRSHTGTGSSEALWECGACGKMYATSNTLRSHVASAKHRKCMQNLMRVNRSAWEIVTEQLGKP